MLFSLWRQGGLIPKDVRLQVRVGDGTDNHRFADKDISGDGEIFRARGHYDADICNNVKINGMFCLIDANTFESGGKAARYTADGDNAKGDTWP